MRRNLESELKSTLSAAFQFPVQFQVLRSMHTGSDMSFMKHKLMATGINAGAETTKKTSHLMHTMYT